MSINIVPINIAEAVIEPFFDRQQNGIRDWNFNSATIQGNISNLSENQWWNEQPESIYVYGDGYSIEPETEQGLKIFQTWCNLSFSWSKKPNSGPALSMHRFFNIECSAYTHVIISMMSPPKSIFTLKVETNIGEISTKYSPFEGLKKEYALDLNGAIWIGKVTLEIETLDDRPASGYFNWIGLQNKQLLEKYLAQWKRFDANWEPYLKPESYDPDFMTGIKNIIGKEEIEAFRVKYKEILNKSVDDEFVNSVNKALSIAPEEMIKDYVNFSTDTRFCRERDYGKALISNGVNLALAGIVLHDKRLLRLAARYALSIAFCTNWTDGFVNKMPGSNFETKAFVASLCTYDVAFILEVAWDYFTVVGRQYIMRRIAEEGIANINWIVWKHAEKPEEIFKMNQLIWFSTGRILGYLAIEKEWKRVGPYTDMAYHDLLESIEQCVLPDGGYLEGPMYFSCICARMISIIFYSAARNKELSLLVPETLKRTASFIEAIASTDDELDFIPICDTHVPHTDLLTFAMMAVLLPKSLWVNIFWKAYNRVNNILSFDKFYTELFVMKFITKIPQNLYELKSFVFLPDMGIMASTRRSKGEVVKLLIMGNKAGAGHTHQDKGSFVLEFAGDTFAMDPGMDSYDSPQALLMGKATMHNMLVPYGINRMYGPQRPLQFDVKPEGSGDTISFHAQIDATPGWGEYYNKWNRTWVSPEPDLLFIKDEYSLVKGDGVEFYWNTKLDVEIKDNVVIIQGKKGKVCIDVPKECEIRIDTLPLPVKDGKVSKQIALRKEGKTGAIEIKVRMLID